MQVGKINNLNFRKNVLKKVTVYTKKQTGKKEDKPCIKIKLDSEPTNITISNGNISKVFPISTPTQK